MLSIEVPAQCTPTDQEVPLFEKKKTVELDGAELGDIPAKYTVPSLQCHEFPAVGVYIDPRVLPGFKYRVRPIHEVIRKIINFILNNPW